MARSLSVRHVRVFRNGKNQAIRIPREFELPGQEAILRKDEQGRLIIEPMKSKNLLSLLSGWAPLKDADMLPPIEDLPAEPIKF
jgi:antitoxin VapB